MPAKDSKPSQARVPKTDEELKKLAQDLIGNRVFMSDQLRNPADLTMVFFPLAMLDEETVQRLRDEKITHVYEYLDKALPRGINGYPMFMSCNLITEAEYKRVRELEQKMRQAMKSALEG